MTRLNFLGLGHTVGVQTLVSTLEQRVLFSYQAPQFTGNRNLALTFSALFDDASDIRTFTSHRLEGSVQLAQRISRQYSLQYRYTIRRVTIPLDSLKITPELVPLLSQPDRAGLVSMSFVQDRRDDPVDSHRGMYNTVDLGYAWSGLGSGTNYTRMSVRNATYHRIGRDMVLAQGTQFGWIHNLGGMPIDIPLAERFFSGGSSTNRAFPDNQAGPRDIGSAESLPTGFPLGGNALLFHSTELRFPLIGNNLGGVLFHDIGNVYADLAGMSFRFRQENIQDFNYAVNSFGFGFRYRTPIGPIRVDFSLSFPILPRFFRILRNPRPTSGRHGSASEPAHQYFSIPLLTGADLLMNRVQRPGALLLCVSAFFAHAGIIDRIAVTVDKQVITESDVVRYLRVAAFLDQKPVDWSPDARREAAGRLVDQILILHEAAESHFTLPAKEDAPNLVDMQKPQFGSEEAYRAALATDQITETDLADHLLSGLKALRFTDLRFRPEIQDTDPEVINQRIMQALDTWLETARKQSRIEYREAAFK